MAQETAGTIGIPVLKNEVLPYIDQYARRRDRAEQLRAAQEYKLASLKQKEKQEAFKYPDMPGVVGNAFAPILKQRRQDRVNALVNEVNGGQKTASDLNMLSMAARTDTEDDNNVAKGWNEQMSARMKDLGEYGVPTGGQLLSSYVNKAYNDTPDANKLSFLNQNHTGQLEEYLISQPSAINKSALGAKLIKNAVKSKYSGQEKLTTESFEWYDDIFDVGEEKLSSGQVAITGNKVNVNKADAFVARDPTAQKIITKLVDEEKKNPLYKNLPEDQKIESAKKQVYNDVFGSYGNVAYKKDIKTAPGRRSGGRSGRAPLLGDSAISFGTTQLPVYDFEVPSGNEIIIGKNVKIYSTKTKTSKVITAGAELANPRIGWMAKDKNTGEIIDPENYGRTPIGNVTFVPGFFGVPTERRFRGGVPAGAQILDEESFVFENDATKAKTIAANQLSKVGKDYKKIQQQKLAEIKKLFSVW